MNTVGIIAEYNPFHNGHRYQIEEIKKKTGAQNIVVVMSGDFVQRGTPAWTDKYLRTQMALANGVSFVFQLPVCFSTASAETFAFAGVSLLTSLGFVDGICFGCECSNLTLLQKIAGFLAHPTKEFEAEIAFLVEKGISYPAAREKALRNIFANECQKEPSLLSSPNNILALEYLKAILLLESPLIPFAIQRNDQGYHHNILTGTFSSATAIRKESLENSSFLDKIAEAVPKEVHTLLEKEPNRFPITENDFSNLLYYRLSNLTDNDIHIQDMTNEIWRRIQNQINSFTNYQNFTAQIKTKQYTYSRISRVLLHCLLNIYDTSDFIPKTKSNCLAMPFVPYARLLGFSTKKSFLLRGETKIPIITKPADGLTSIRSFYAEQASSISIPEQEIEDACKMYQQDIFASNLYYQVQCSVLGCQRPDEYRSKPVIY